MDFISRIIGVPLGWILKVCYNLFGNYAAAILLFTVIIQFLLLPFTIKQKKTQAQTTALLPETKRIQKQFAKNRERMQEETMKLQQESGVKQAAGCGQLLIQLPILYGLLEVIYKPITYILGISESVINDLILKANLIPGTIIDLTRTKESLLIEAIQKNPGLFSGGTHGAEVSAIQGLNLDFLGMDLSGMPRKELSVYVILPVLAGVAALLYALYTRYLNNKSSLTEGEQVPGGILMVLLSPVLSIMFGFNFPLGVNLYWAIRSLVMVVQEFFLDKVMPQKELVKNSAAEMAEKRKAARGLAKKKRTKKIVDDDGNEVEVEVSQHEYNRKKLSASRKQDEERYGDGEEGLSEEDLAKLNEARRRDSERYGETFA